MSRWSVSWRLLVQVSLLRGPLRGPLRLCRGLRLDPLAGSGYAENVGQGVVAFMTCEFEHRPGVVFFSGIENVQRLVPVVLSSTVTAHSIRPGAVGVKRSTRSSVAGFAFL